ncbi:MAG: serpin family protein [Thiohalocapsa sp.]|uniref:serpin family protein n=1 Tax=Thiohalocapsa sp. TaxID=2497641 RepID=UPI0025CE0453|nr:serpin family protein [Thiohalocapsa sp.]MCG6941550.1 serpin family protein [Thiohalocapsa sp.]
MMTLSDLLPIRELPNRAARMTLVLALCAVAFCFPARQASAQADYEAVLESNTAFAFDLYQRLAAAGDGNLFFSPYSMSMALAMTYAGARGETETQMAEALHFTLPQAELNPAFAALDAAIRTPPADANVPEEERLILNIANALWGQEGFPFRQDYVDLLDRYYNAPLILLDFQTAPEDARQVINDWVAEKTEDRIQDLLPEGSVDAMTRLVLTNAIYFYGQWASQFNEGATADEAFTLLDGTQVMVPMMHQVAPFGYTAGAGYQAIRLPYTSGQGAMLVILPDEGRFDDVEAQLNAEFFQDVLDDLPTRSVILTMPRWKLEYEVSLDGVLRALGMTDAFDPQAADFSGMADLSQAAGNLFISAALHKAFVSVDENGTEAAAATGIVAGVTSMPITDVTLRLDRPFIYAIVDGNTGSILFLGRLLDPS